MGMLVDGVWVTDAAYARKSDGQFVRRPSTFRDWITPDGSAGPGQRAGFRAEAGRYHLYISHACPWAHRTRIVRRVKGLEDMIGLSVVQSFMGEDGWVFGDEPGATRDTLNGADKLSDIYLLADPEFTGRVTVPVLWDIQEKTIVSNESSEIIRMFNSAFDEIGADRSIDLYPQDLRADIDAINASVYETVNNGVYRAGFATSQQAYDDAVQALFATLERIERRLATRRFLLGDTITEADWRLFTTLVRFDPVYHGHFKCNLRALRDYGNLWPYLRDLYQVPGISETVNMAHIKAHYYASHLRVNPTGIVPAGPILDLDAPHGRDRLSQRPAAVTRRPASPDRAR